MNNPDFKREMEARFGADKDKALRVAEVAALLSKIGFAHEGLKPDVRATYKRNREFAKQLLLQLKPDLMQALGLTDEQFGLFLEAIYREGTFGIGTEMAPDKFTNPLTALLTVAAEADVSSKRLPGWQNNRAFMRALSRISTDPQVMLLYSQRSRLELLKNGAILTKDPQKISEIERKIEDHRKRFDNAIRSLVKREIEDKSEIVIKGLEDEGYSPREAEEIYEQIVHLAVTIDSQSYLWLLSSYGISDTRVTEEGHIVLMNRTDRTVGLGSAANLFHVKEFHPNRIRSVISDIKDAFQVQIDLDESIQREDEEMHAFIDTSEKGETHNHEKMAEDFDSDVWDKIILGKPTGRFDDLVKKAQDKMNSLRRARGLPEDLDLHDSFKTALVSARILFKFVRLYNPAFVAGYADVNELEDKDLIVAEVQNLLTALGDQIPASHRKTVLNAMDLYRHSKYYIFNLFNFQEGSLPLFVQAFGGVGALLKMADRKRITKNALRNQQRVNVKYYEPRFNIGSRAETLNEILTVIQAYKEWVAEQKKENEARRARGEPELAIPEMRLILSITKFSDEHKELKERIAHKTDSAEIFTGILREAREMRDKPDGYSSVADKEGIIISSITGENAVTPDDVLRFVGGIDAAGQEEHNPPSLFFEAFSIFEKYKREVETYNGKNPARQIPIPGGTFHVAESIEDVSIESGIRHALEAIFMRFLKDVDMKSSERVMQRLGHAIMIALPDYRQLLGTTKKESLQERIQQVEHDLALLRLGVPLLAVNKDSLERELEVLQNPVRSPDDMAKFGISADGLTVVYQYDSEDKIQDLETRAGFVRDRLINYGIVVETNPTSNVGVASPYISGYETHTLKRYLDPHETYGHWAERLAANLESRKRNLEQISGRTTEQESELTQVRANLANLDTYLQSGEAQANRGKHVKVSINTDDPTMFGTDLTEEIYRMAVALDLSFQQVAALIRAGLETPIGSRPLEDESGIRTRMDALDRRAEKMDDDRRIPIMRDLLPADTVKVKVFTEDGSGEFIQLSQAQLKLIRPGPVPASLTAAREWRGVHARVQELTEIPGVVVKVLEKSVPSGKTPEQAFTKQMNRDNFEDAIGSLDSAVRHGRDGRPGLIAPFTVLMPGTGQGRERTVIVQSQAKERAEMELDTNRKELIQDLAHLIRELAKLGLFIKLDVPGSEGNALKNIGRMPDGSLQILDFFNLGRITAQNIYREDALIIAADIVHQSARALDAEADRAEAAIPTKEDILPVAVQLATDAGYFLHHVDDVDAQTRIARLDTALQEALASRRFHNNEAALSLLKLGERILVVVNGVRRGGNLEEDELTALETLRHQLDTSNFEGAIARELLDDWKKMLQAYGDKVQQTASGRSDSSRVVKSQESIYTAAALGIMTQAASLARGIQKQAVVVATITPRQRLINDIEDSQEFKRVDRLEQILRNDLARPEFAGDDALRLMVYKALRAIAGTSEPRTGSYGYQTEMRAREILEAEWPEIEARSASSKPQKVLVHGGRKDTLEIITERLWKQLAYADLIDLRQPSGRITADKVNAKVDELQNRGDLQNTVKEMAKKELETLGRIVKHLKKRGAGVVDEETFDQTPAFIPQIREIFNKVLNASGFTDAGLFQLYFLNDSRMNAAAIKTAPDRVLIETDFLQSEMEAGRLTEDLIAGILAHEIGHVISRLKSVLKTGKPPDLEKERGLRGTSKSHAEEDYADLVSIKIVDQTGEYSLKGLTRFFEKLAAEAEDTSATDELLGMISHPAHRMRFRDQTRHVLNAPYRNKNKPERELNQTFHGSLVEFPGTFSSLRPLDRDSGTIRNLMDEAESLKSAIDTTPVYDTGTIKIHLNRANALLERFRVWLDANPGYEAWRQSWKIREGNYGNSGLINQLIAIVATLNDHNSVNGDAELPGLFQASLTGLHESIDGMRQKAGQFNNSDEFDLYLGTTGFRGYRDHRQMRQEYDPWLAAYKTALLRDLNEPDLLLQRVSRGKVNKYVLLEVLQENRSQLTQTLGANRYFYMLAVTLEGQHEQLERDRNIVEWVRDAVGNELSWEMALKVLNALPRNSWIEIVYPRDRSQNRNIYDPANLITEIRTKAFQSSDGAKGQFLQWLLNYNAESYVVNSVAELPVPEQKSFIVSLFTPQNMATKNDLLLRFLKEFIPENDLNLDDELMRSLFEAIEKIHGTRKQSNLDVKLAMFEELFKLMWDANQRKPANEQLTAADYIIQFFSSGGFVSPEYLQRFYGFDETAQRGQPLKITSADEMAAVREFFESNMDFIIQNWSRAAGHKATAQMLSKDEVAQHYRLLLGIRHMELQESSSGFTVKRFSTGYSIFAQPFSRYHPIARRVYVHQGDELMERIRLNGPIDPQAKYREELENAYPFIFSTLSYEQTMALIETYLPKSVYKTYALFLALVVKKLGLSADQAFDRDAIKAALERMNQAERLDTVSRIGALMDFDLVMASANSGMSGAFMLEQKKGLILTVSEKAAYESDFEGFQNAYYMSSWKDVGDRPETQMDLFLASLLEEIDLKSGLEGFIQTQQNADPAKDYEMKLARIRTFFPRSTSERDIYLRKLADTIYESDMPIQSKLSMINDLVNEHLHGAQVKQGLSLKLLDMETTMILQQFKARTISREELLRQIPAKIVEYFPKASPIRDDLLDSFIEKNVETVPEFRELGHLYSTVYSSDGRSLEAREAEGEGETGKNMVLFVMDNLKEPTLKIEFLLWLLGFNEKPAFLKKMELQYRVNLDYLQQSTGTQELTNYSRIGKSVQREFLQGLLWDKGGIFAGLGKESAQRKQLLDALFNNIFKGKTADSFEKRIWDIFFEKAPEKSWPITEKILTNMLGLLATVKQKSETVDSSQMTALMLAASGVVGMKLGQLLHSFGYVSEEFKIQLESLKSNSPVPFMKRDLFRMLEYYGIEDVRVFNKLGEASIKAVYRVERNNRQFALKVKKPFVDREAEDGLAILGSMLESIEALGPAPAEGQKFELPKWLVSFLHRTIHDELLFDDEVKSARALKAQMERPTGIADIWNLVNVLLTYEGGWFNPGAWKRVMAMRKEGRAPGKWTVGVKDSYTAGEWMGRPADAIPDMILDELVMNATDYTKVSADETVGLEDDLAPGFIISLVRGFYHADLHEGNIMVEKGGVNRSWLLDTGAMGTISQRDLKRVALLLRALRMRDAVTARKCVAALYGNIEMTAAEQEKIIKESFDRGNVMQSIFHILKEMKGDPRYDFLQLIKAFTAAGFILRHLSIIPDKEEARLESAGPGEEVTEEAPEPIFNADQASVGTLVDMVISDRTAESDKISALQKLVGAVAAITERWSMTDEQRRISDITDTVLTEIIANKNYPDELRGAAFKLFNALISKSMLSTGRHYDEVYHASQSDGLGRHSSALTQELLERNALSIQPDDTARLDYLDGLLMVYELAGNVEENRDDVLDGTHVLRLKEMVLDERFSQSIRTRAAVLLVQRLNKQYGDLKANDVISGTLLGLLQSGSADSLRVEVAMLDAYAARDSDRLFNVPEFRDYIEGRLNTVFAGDVATRMDIQPLFRVVMRGTQYLGNLGEDEYKDFISRFVFGNPEQIADRFLKAFGLMTPTGDGSRTAHEVLAEVIQKHASDRDDSPIKQLLDGYVLDEQTPLTLEAYAAILLDQSNKGQVASHVQAVLAYVERFVKSVASSIEYPDGGQPQIPPEQQSELFNAARIRNVLTRLEAVPFFALASGVKDLSSEAWTTFRSLWNLAINSGDEELLRLMRRSLTAQMDFALTAGQSQTNAHEWNGAPVYMPLMYDFAESFKIHSGMAAGVDLPVALRDTESRLLVRDSATRALLQVISDVKSNPNLLANDRTRNSVLRMIEGLTKTYLYTALFDHSSGEYAQPIMLDDSERSKMREILSGLFTLVLDARLSVESRVELFLQHLDLQNIDWKDSVGNFYNSHEYDELRNHPFLVENRDLFFQAAEEAALQSGIDFGLPNISERNTRALYQGLARYFLENRDAGRLMANDRFADGIRVIHDEFDQWQHDRGDGNTDQDTANLVSMTGAAMKRLAGDETASLTSMFNPGKGVFAEAAALGSAATFDEVLGYLDGKDPGQARELRNLLDGEEARTFLGGPIAGASTLEEFFKSTEALSQREGVSPENLEKLDKFRDRVQDLVFDVYIKDAHDSGRAENIITSRYRPAFMKALVFLSMFSEGPDESLPGKFAKLQKEGRIRIIRAAEGTRIPFAGHASAVFGINLVEGAVETEQMSGLLVHEFFAWLGEQQDYPRMGDQFGVKMEELYVSYTDPSEESKDKFGMMVEELRAAFRKSRDARQARDISKMAAPILANEGTDPDLLRWVLESAIFHRIPDAMLSLHRSFFRDIDNRVFLTYLQIHDWANRLEPLASGAYYYFGQEGLEQDAEDTLAISLENYGLLQKNLGILRDILADVGIENSLFVEKAEPVDSDEMARDLDKLLEGVTEILDILNKLKTDYNSQTKRFPPINNENIVKITDFGKKFSAVWQKISGGFAYDGTLEGDLLRKVFLRMMFPSLSRENSDSVAAEMGLNPALVGGLKVYGRFLEKSRRGELVDEDINEMDRAASAVESILGPGILDLARLKISLIYIDSITKVTNRKIPVTEMEEEALKNAFGVDARNLLRANWVRKQLKKIEPPGAMDGEELAIAASIGTPELELLLKDLKLDEVVAALVDEKRGRGEAVKIITTNAQGKFNAIKAQALKERGEFMGWFKEFSDVRALVGLVYSEEFDEQVSAVLSKTLALAAIYSDPDDLAGLVHELKTAVTGEAEKRLAGIVADQFGQMTDREREALEAILAEFLNYLKTQFKGEKIVLCINLPDDQKGVITEALKKVPFFERFVILGGHVKQGDFNVPFSTVPLAKNAGDRAIQQATRHAMGEQLLYLFTEGLGLKNPITNAMLADINQIGATKDQAVVYETVLMALVLAGMKMPDKEWSAEELEKIVSEMPGGFQIGFQRGKDGVFEVEVLALVASLIAMAKERAAVEKAA